MTGIYSWASIDGWIAFLSDLAWQHSPHINLFHGNANYRSDLSDRQNRHVYEGGALKSEFAFTQGNVISNAGALRVGSAAPLRGGEFASPDFFVRLLV